MGEKEILRRVFFIFFILLVLSSFSFAQTVLVAEINGNIDAGTASYIGRVIDEANAQGVDFVILKINSNGGLIKPTRGVIDKITGSNVSVACFSSEKFGGAFSSGAYVMMSCDVAAVAPESFVGYAAPYPGDNASLESMGEYMGYLAQINNRSVYSARELVYTNDYMGGADALNAGIVDYSPNTTADLVRELFSGKVSVGYLDSNVLDVVAGLLSNPQVSAFFFLVGCLAGLYAFKAKEVRAALLMFVSFIIALYGMQFITFSALGIVLLLLGMALIAVEMMHARPTIFGIAGGIAASMGMMTITSEPFYRVGGVTYLLVFVLTFVVVVPSILLANRFGRERQEKKHSEAESLIGKKGRVIEELKRNGLVKVEGKSWPAYSYVEEKIGVDEVIEVLRLEGRILSVVREKGPKMRGHGGHGGHGGHDEHDKESAHGDTHGHH